MIVTHFGIKRAAIDHRPDDRDHDVDDLKEIEHEAQHEQHQHHDQEDRQFVVEAAQELLDVVLAAKGDHHKVQQLRADQDGEDHRGHLGRLAHHRRQHARGEQDPAGEQQPEQRKEIGDLGDEEGDPVFEADTLVT